MPNKGKKPYIFNRNEKLRGRGLGSHERLVGKKNKYLFVEHWNFIYLHGAVEKGKRKINNRISRVYSKHTKKNLESFVYKIRTKIVLKTNEIFWKFKQEKCRHGQLRKPEQTFLKKVDYKKRKMRV